MSLYDGWKRAGWWNSNKKSGKESARRREYKFPRTSRSIPRRRICSDPRDRLDNWFSTSWSSLAHIESTVVNVIAKGYVCARKKEVDWKKTYGALFFLSSRQQTSIRAVHDSRRGSVRRKSYTKIQICPFWEDAQPASALDCLPHVLIGVLGK